MKAFAVAVIALFLTACASGPTVQTDSDPSANFSAYRTYSWAQKPTVGSPLVQQRIVDGIDARLRAKGWTLAPEGGDVAIAAHVATSQKQTLDTFYQGGAMGGWGWRGGMAMGSSTTTVRTYNIGTLIVDMFDGKTHQAVWRGTASDTVPDSPEKVNATVEAALDKLFASFPPGTKPSP